MAITDLYVDPSIAADSGAGTIGDPYGDLEYCIEQENWVAGGIRVNIKAGTDEVLAASLETALADTTSSTAWVPTETGPLIFQGYTSASQDGGVGGISGGGSLSVINTSTLDYIAFIDMHLHNAGAANVVTVDNFCTFTRCEINNTSGAGIVCGISCRVFDCHIHDIGASGVSGSAVIERCLLETGPTNDFTNAIYSPSSVRRCLIKVTGAGNGMQVFDAASVSHCSIYSDGGTGSGIYCLNSAMVGSVVNNLVEGFSGSGGYGIEFHATNSSIRYWGGNSVYNCATAIGTPEFALDYIGGNETLAASPFTSASTGDFSPVDTGSVKEGALPATFPS